MLDKSPVFIKGQEKDFSDYLSKHVCHKESIDIFYDIEHSELAPNKALQDAVNDMMNGMEVFNLIDEQKVVYEQVLQSVRDSLNSNKKTMIICQGGPGTGKSVVALKLICALVGMNKSACYVTKNEAPRKVFGNIKRNDIDVQSLFKGAGAFQIRYGTRDNQYDCIVVDEAHRLDERGFSEPGTEIHHLPGIVRASKVSVFFIDENQKVTVKDIGTTARLKAEASTQNADVIEGMDFNLVTQFRCGGSDGFIGFLDNVLYNNNGTYEIDSSYEIRIFDSPTKMRLTLQMKNEINNKARIVAGYCYEWQSQNDLTKYDIYLKDNFVAKWNFRKNNYIWATDPNSFDEVGCIHTSQGLEFDYCGVIVGNDMRYENGRVITDQSKIAKTDKASGIRTCKDIALADQLIRNTYRTLMTRGQKGCYIYCEDKALADYLLSLLHMSYADSDDGLTPSQRTGLQTLLAGENCFVTGEGGTGKSFLIDRFMDIVHGRKNILKCAPTGIAAAHIGGQTIYKSFRIPITPAIKTKMDLAYGKVIEYIARYDVIIIDEISMCRIDLLEYVMRTIDAATIQKGSPIQVILCGDFFQLPPVVTDEEAPILEQIYGTKDGYAFESDEWKSHNFKNIKLIENVRQGHSGNASAAAFMKYLNNLRAHRDVQETIGYFNDNSKKAKNNDNVTVELHATNDMVDYYNAQGLDKLPGTEHTYTAEITGTFPADKYPVAELITLKDGAKIMVLVNDKNGNYQNGSIGIVERCLSDGVLVRINNHTEYITPHEFTVSQAPVLDSSSGIVIQDVFDGKYKQIPLRLAYAVTVHKSQGQTFEHVNFDPKGNAKENLQNGQLYVALSRIKSVEGLYLYNPIAESEWQTSQKVIDFYTYISSSEVAESGIKSYALDDIILIKSTPLTFSMIIKNVRAGIKDNGMTPDASLVYQYLIGTLAITKKKVYYGWFKDITEGNVSQLYESYIASLEC